MSKGLLLDTHTLLWWLYEAESLSGRSFDMISDGSIDIYVSAVSAMEIATKHRSGRLPGAAGLVGNFVTSMEVEGFKPLAITAAHGDLAGSFSGSHRDPWDRLLAAQAIIDDVTLVSNDIKLREFGIEPFW